MTDLQSTSKISSRRMRPAKTPLNREAIITTALQILQSDGLPGLSLRKVASSLDTGAASLYVYFENLESLQSSILDHALGAVHIPERSSKPWQEQLRGILESYFQTLCSAPGLAQLALATIPAGTNSLRITERMLGLLLQGKIQPMAAAWAVDLLLLHSTSVAAEQSLRQFSDQVLERTQAAFAEAPADQYPLIHSLQQEMLSGGKSRFRWAMDVLLVGIQNHPATVNRKSSRRNK